MGTLGQNSTTADFVSTLAHSLPPPENWRIKLRTAPPPNKSLLIVTVQEQKSPRSSMVVVNHSLLAFLPFQGHVVVHARGVPIGLQEKQAAQNRAHSSRHATTTIGGTQHVLNHFAGDPSYDEDACQRLIQKHVRHHTWNTSVTTYDEYMKCPRAPKNKSAGPNEVPPHLLRHLPEHIQKQLCQAILDV